MGKTTKSMPVIPPPFLRMLGINPNMMKEIQKQLESIDVDSIMKSMTIATELKEDIEEIKKDLKEIKEAILK